MYRIAFTKEAGKDLALLEKHAPFVFKKLASLLEEMAQHPRMGTGKVEPLRYRGEEIWSRRLNREHRLVYHIDDAGGVVTVLSVLGHYE